MKRFSLDTSCMVAAVCSWHERHAAAAAAIGRRFRRAERLTVAAHALVETYAVLTRLPMPHRLAPTDAWALIKANFVDQADVISLDSEAQVALLSRLAAGGVSGGRSYDALIAECARKGSAGALLTFNTRHFSSSESILIEEP
jgi:predicted nucleic acid-binding protein